MHCVCVDCGEEQTWSLATRGVFFGTVQFACSVGARSNKVSLRRINISANRPTCAHLVLNKKKVFVLVQTIANGLHNFSFGFTPLLLHFRQVYYTSSKHLTLESHKCLQAYTHSAHLPTTARFDFGIVISDLTLMARPQRQCWRRTQQKWQDGRSGKSRRRLQNQ